MNEDRQSRRFGPLVIKAHIEEGGTRWDGYLTNVSAGGAFFAIESPPEVETELELRAAMPWKLGELHARVRVVWRNGASRAEGEPGPPIPGVGLAFLDVPAASRATLEAYLAKFEELAAQIDGK